MTRGHVTDDKRTCRRWHADMSWMTCPCVTDDSWTCHIWQTLAQMSVICNRISTSLLITKTNVNPKNCKRGNIDQTRLFNVTIATVEYSEETNLCDWRHCKISWSVMFTAVGPHDLLNNVTVCLLLSITSSFITSQSNGNDCHCDLLWISGTCSSMHRGCSNFLMPFILLWCQQIDVIFSNRQLVFVATGAAWTTQVDFEHDWNERCTCQTSGGGRIDWHWNPVSGVDL